MAHEAVFPASSYSKEQNSARFPREQGKRAEIYCRNDLLAAIGYTYLN